MANDDMTPTANVKARVPPFNTFLLPALETLVYVQERVAGDAAHEVSTSMKLDQTQLAESLASGHSRVTKRVAWSVHPLPN